MPAIPGNIDTGNFKISFSPSKRTQLKKVFVSIEGECTIDNISLLKEALVSTMGAFDAISIKLSNINKIDLSAIQLMYQANALFSNKQKTMTMNTSLADEDKGLLSICGFTSLLNKLMSGT